MKNLYKALSAFQQSCPVISKGTEGYGYTYADLPTIYETILPLLKANGLGFTQILKDDGLETIVFHIESGEELKGFVKIPTGVSLAKMNVYQVMGSAYTYYRRYALSAILGIITEVDDDCGQSEAPLPVANSKPVADEKPWLTEEQYQRMIEAIDDGKGEMVKEKMYNYRMKTIYRTGLTSALTSALNPVPKTEADKAHLEIKKVLADSLEARATEEIRLEDLPF